MIKIIALNQKSENQDENSNESEEIVSKEAQETIAVSEYLRALSLKQEGKVDIALNLFLELLEAQVLEVSENNKDNKLFSVKYNCFRNVGFIYEEKGDFKAALKYLVEAIDLDDTDVYTQYKIGKLALKVKNLTLAKIAFEKCLHRNPNHWPSKDGLLETLCLLESINSAYGWALTCYNEDKNYERAIKVLLEVREKFKSNISYFDNFWKCKFEPPKDYKIKYEDSVFPPYQEYVMQEENYFKTTHDEFKDFQFSDSNWITFGNWIVKLYKHLMDNGYNVCSWYRLEDFLKPEEITNKPDNPDPVNGNNHEELMDSENAKIDSEETEKGGTVEEIPETNIEISKKPENPTVQLLATESKQKMSGRRRGSDLTFLEQWGWHKNRRSTRKKSLNDQTENTDTTANGYIKRILPNYFTESISSKVSPFVDDDSQFNEDQVNSENEKMEVDSEEDLEKFYEISKESFSKFLDTLKDRDFDIIIPVYQWLKYVSIHWTQKIPTEICNLFVEIYEIHENFIDYCALHHLDDEDLRAHFRMAIFYFELVFDDIEESTKMPDKKDVTDEFIRTKDYMGFYTGFLLPFEEYTVMIIRTYWFNYCIQKHKKNFPEALNYLYKVEEILEKPENRDVEISLKNQKNNNFIDIKNVKELIVKIERKINLINVKKLYDTNNFAELIEILQESIVYSTEPKVNMDSLTLKIQTQIEVLLESFWNVDRIEDCLNWTEKALKYSVDNFLVAPTEFRLTEWAAIVNFCLVYLEAIIKQEGSDIMISLNKNLSRLIQTLTQIITHQLDNTQDKNPQPHLINLTIPWVVLFYLLQKEDDASFIVHKKVKSSCENSNEVDDGETDAIPNSVMVFFTAHDFLGRKQWCSKDGSKLLLFGLDVITPILRSPMLEHFRDVVGENIEQMTYCLYGYPTKKARSRHIEEHDSEHVELTWERAIQLFEIYRPDTLPEFDSFKLASITNDMEQLLQKIVPLIPKSMDVVAHVTPIKSFINGTEKTLPREINLLPPRIASIYYLLADYYFKIQETQKAIKYYIYDLAIKPERFDSWAGLALSKASKLETKLNSFGNINVKEFMEHADSTSRCFQQSLTLKNTNTIWAEFGSFSYNLQSFCSKSLKQFSDTLSMESFSEIEQHKERYLQLSHKCFTTVNDSEGSSKKSNNDSTTGDENHDEKWYYHFMLGKIAEKRKEHPSVYLDHYLKSAKYLYENNATYPIKINHSNPSNLAVEALEVFYRITSAILKYLEQQSKINKSTAKLFKETLKELSSSPFAYNRAKINEDNLNALKRKLEKSATAAATTTISTNNDECPEKKAKPDDTKMDTESGANVQMSDGNVGNSNQVENKSSADLNVKEAEITSAVSTNAMEIPAVPVMKRPQNPPASSSEIVARRESQESAVTTTTSTSSSSSDSSSSDSSSSDSDDSTSSGDESGKENEFLTQEQIDNIYKICIKNLEECITRFPEHYKSIFRLTYHYKNASGSTRSIEKCKQLLLGTYKTTLGNNIQGLYTERKTNNFFNGIWRIPSQEIDRPGNFTSHLAKCVTILMDVLTELNDHVTLLELALHLQKTPDADKKYLNDSDRKELYQQAITCCTQTMKKLLKEYTVPEKNDHELLNLMVEIFKAHRKCVKHMHQNQGQFSTILIDVYKAYIKDRMTLPDNASFMDLAVKLCQQELNYRKNLEKGIIGVSPASIQPPVVPSVSVVPSNPPVRHIEVKSVSEINKSIEVTTVPSTVTSNPPKSTNPRSRSRTSSVTSKSNPSSASNLTSSTAMNSLLLSMYSDPTLLSTLTTMDAASMSSFLTEYYKLLGLPSSSAGLSSLTAGMTSMFNMGGSPTKTLNQLSQLGMLSGMGDLLGTQPKATTSSSVASSQPTASTSKASIKPTSTFEMKYLESLSSNFMSSKSQPVGKSSSLSTNSLSTLAKAGTSIIETSSAKKSNVGQASNRKSTGSLPNIGKSLLSGGLKLPTDLPKSLSITPTGPVKSNISGNVGKVALDRQKNVMKTARDQAHPYKQTKPQSSKAMSSHLLTNLKANPSLSITPDVGMARGYNASNSNSQSALLSTYQSLLKSYGAASGSNVGNLVIPPASSSRQTSSKKSVKPQTTINPTQKSSVTKSQLPSYDLGKNIAQFSTLPKSSPTTSIKSLPSPQQRELMMSKSPFSNISGRSSTSLTPTPPLSASPLTSSQSPAKTLQQKLAEKQKMNQQIQQHIKKPDNSSDQNRPSKTIDEVIILD